MDINSLAIRTVFELAVEDLYPVWEVLWGLRTVWPSTSDKELRRLAVESIESLWRNGSVGLHCRSGNGEIEPCQSVGSVESLLSDDDVWTPEGSFQVYVLATEKGDDEYYQRGVQP
jgi:hypothetical protein